jgi:hypothetical protein
MDHASLKRFMSLHNQILAERRAVIARLRDLDEKLEAMGFNATVRHYGIHTPSGRVRNKTSLKKAVVNVIANRSMTKEEVLRAVLASGYQFNTDDPMNSLGVILYGKNPKFENVDGRFNL